MLFDLVVVLILFLFLVLILLLMFILILFLFLSFDLFWVLFSMALMLCLLISMFVLRPLRSSCGDGGVAVALNCCAFCCVAASLAESVSAVVFLFCRVIEHNHLNVSPSDLKKVKALSN